MGGGAAGSVQETYSSSFTLALDSILQWPQLQRSIIKIFFLIKEKSLYCIKPLTLLVKKQGNSPNTHGEVRLFPTVRTGPCMRRPRSRPTGPLKSLLMSTPLTHSTSPPMVPYYASELQPSPFLLHPFWHPHLLLYCQHLPNSSLTNAGFFLLGTSSHLYFPESENYSLFLMWTPTLYPQYPKLRPH